MLKHWTFCLFCFSLSNFCSADFSAHLKKDTSERVQTSQIKNIDYIYLINLDQRPEKYKSSLDQLSPYGVIPHRFSGVYGWDLSPEVINDIGVKFSPEMSPDQWIRHYSSKDTGISEIDFLRKENYGKTVFSRWMTPGAMGCALSHLSVLQDAYERGYETIWVMEDDVFVEGDPKLLGDLIEKLDALVGKEGWDILYTDTDKADKGLYFEDNDFETDLKGDLYFLARPDLNLSDRARFAKRTIISDDFIKIGSRMRTHSMIIRRSGMKKILDFEKNFHLFLPYDHEIPIVPGIKLVNLRYNHVTTAASPPSDIRVGFFNPKTAWEECKAATLSDLTQILGWKNPEKAEKLMEFIRETKPTTCVEIGAFGGAITYPIAKTLKFLKQGIVHAIDAWDRGACIEGLEPGKIFNHWLSLDMDATLASFQRLLSSKEVGEYCRAIRGRSKDAVSLFEDGAVDLLYIDGNSSKKGTYEDVVLYFPKVKEGGYIWLNDADQSSKSLGLAFLMKHCEWIKEKSMGTSCVLFRKKAVENLPTTFVQARMRGELCNNMFIVAAAVALAEENGVEAYFPELHTTSAIHTDHIFHRCNLEPPLSSSKALWTEPSFAYHEIPFFPAMTLTGYFQSEKYFVRHRQKILDLFAPRSEDLEYIRSKYQAVLHHPCSVAVHVREYLDGAVHIQYGKDYLRKAAALFPQEAQFVLFSDNMNFAKQILPEEMKGRTVFVEGEPNYIDLFFMSLCKHNIIANSTFSWWGAWLNQNPEKIVVAPAQWLHPSSNIATGDVVPESWIRVEAQYGPCRGPYAYPRVQGYYSQCSQDRILNEWWFKNKKEGVFVDIGAHDGVSLSNTKYFEELGWKGLCVEPIPAVFEKLKSNRTCLCIQGCVSDHKGKDVLLKVEGEPEMLSGLLSKYDPRHLERVYRESAKRSYGKEPEEIAVECYLLNDLLQEHGFFHVDLLSLDTEGGELDILRTIDFDRFDIAFIDVENNFNDPAILHFLESKGYEHMTNTGGDDIFKKIKVMDTK